MNPKLFELIKRSYIFSKEEESKLYGEKGEGRTGIISGDRTVRIERFFADYSMIDPNVKISDNLYAIFLFEGEKTDYSNNKDNNLFMMENFYIVNSDKFLSLLSDLSIDYKDGQKFDKFNLGEFYGILRLIDSTQKILLNSSGERNSYFVVEKKLLDDIFKERNNICGDLNDHIDGFFKKDDYNIEFLFKLNGEYQTKCLSLYPTAEDDFSGDLTF